MLRRAAEPRHFSTLRISRQAAARMRCGLPPPAARISVALLRKAASCFGCSRNVNVSFVVTSAAALDQDLRLEVHAALDVMLDVIAVLLRREPRDSEFAAVDAQPRSAHGFRRCGICDLNDLLKVFVGLRLARAYWSRKSYLTRAPHVPRDATC